MFVDVILGFGSEYFAMIRNLCAARQTIAFAESSGLALKCVVKN